MVTRSSLRVIDIPTPHMRSAFVRWAELCGDVTDLMADGKHVGSRGGEEACGVFFYPDRRFGIGLERPTVPAFIPINNVWEPVRERAANFAFDGDTMRRNIAMHYIGEPSGKVQLVHSHLGLDGPSDLDYATVLAFEEGLSQHPIWSATDKHLIYHLGDGQWTEYGKPEFVESTGPRIG